MIRLTDKQYKALQDRETELLGQVGHLSTELVEARCKLDKERAHVDSLCRDLVDVQREKATALAELDIAKRALADAEAEIQMNDDQIASYEIRYKQVIGQRDALAETAGRYLAQIGELKAEVVKARAAADKKAEERTRALKAELNHAHSIMGYKRAIDLEWEVRTWRLRYEDLLSRWTLHHAYVAPQPVYVGIDPETRQVGKSAMLGMGYGMDPYTIFGMGIKEVAGLKDRVHLLTIDNDTLRAECKKQYAAVLELTERNGRQADALAKVRAKKS